MHSLTEVGTNVPAFLAKLWKLVGDEETNDLICWNEIGSGFVIHNQAQFCRELLPLYYKHNNMASFVRQLNMYGFHKKVSVDSGGLKLDRDEMEFAHPCFLKNQAFLLENIKRKIAETVRGVGKTPEVINRVLGDVKQMKGRQENLDTKLSSMKRENEALWRELAVLRQKHHKQQQIVNKLIQFLLTVVQTPGNRLGIKRRYSHLMLNDKEHHVEGEETHHHRHHHHKHKHHRQGSEASPSAAPATITSPTAFAAGDLSTEMRNGPTIHELDPNSEFILPDKGEGAEETRSSGMASPPQYESPSVSVQSPENVEEPRSPASPSEEFALEEDTGIPSELLLEDTASTSDRPRTSSDLAVLSYGGGDDTSQTSVNRWGSLPLGDEFDSHLDTMQTDLDGLKELLMSKDSCNLDANTLLSLFADDPVSLGMGLPSQEDRDDADTIGSELIAYNPTLFDLTEEMGASNDGMDETSLFADDADNLLEQGNSMQGNSELSTPNPKAECPDFSEPSKKKKK